VSNLSTIERRREIVNQASNNGRVLVDALAEQYKVSTVTIRNDLNHMDRNGVLVRTRGGAIASTRLIRELSVQERYSEHRLAKQRLGLAVADLLTDGEAVILDSGTTTEEVAQCLSAFKDLVVITNGLNVASALADLEDIEVRITGGTLRRKTMSFYGPLAEDSLRQINVSKTILGADGFDLKSGVTTHFEPEAALNRMMCDVANDVIVVTDSSKADRQGLHTVVALTGISTFVTDSGLPDSYAQELERLGVDLRIVDI